MNSTDSSTGRLAGRIAVITGASRGIGRAVALRFAEEGAQTVLIARTVGGLEEADDLIRERGGLPPVLVPLDLREGDKIDELGGVLYQRYGKLDILVGNAGLLGSLSPVGHIEPKTWDDALAVNLTANYRLIRSFDPLLRQSEAGRAIFVTSGASAKPAAFWGIYGASKAGLDMLIKCYAEEVARFGVKVNLISPGPVRTKMRAQAFPGEDPLTLRAPDEVTDAFVELAAADCEANGTVVSLS